MEGYDTRKVKVVAQTYASDIDFGQKLKNLKLDPGWKIVEKWLIDRRREAVDPLLVDTTLPSDDVKMQVVLQRFKVEFVDAVFAFMETAISESEEMSTLLEKGDAKTVPDDTIINPRQ